MFVEGGLHSLKLTAKMHPQSLTWNLKMMISKRNLLSRGWFSDSMLNFRGVPEKMVVGKLYFPFGKTTIFSGKLAVSFRQCSCNACFPPRKSPPKASEERQGRFSLVKRMVLKINKLTCWYWKLTGIPPALKLTYPLKMDPWQRRLLFGNHPF